jgi:hypothetical protein
MIKGTTTGCLEGPHPQKTFNLIFKTCKRSICKKNLTLSLTICFDLCMVSVSTNLGVQFVVILLKISSASGGFTQSHPLNPKPEALPLNTTRARPQTHIQARIPALDLHSPSPHYTNPWNVPMVAKPGK